MERKKTKNSQSNIKSLSLLEQALIQAETEGHEIQIVYKDGSDIDSSLLAFNRTGRVIKLDDEFLVFSFEENRSILEYTLKKSNISSALVKPKLQPLL